MEPSINELRVELTRVVLQSFAIAEGRLDMNAEELQDRILTLRVQFAGALYRIGQSTEEMAEELDVDAKEVERLLRLGGFDD